MKFLLLQITIILCIFSCSQKPTKKEISVSQIYPVFISDTTINDTDDPAIWYNYSNSEKSLILGTDKGDSTGGIFVFDIYGKLIDSLCIKNLKRPNNIDVAYNFKFNNTNIDIAVFTERGRNMIRVISLPDCKFIDNGGIIVFEDDSLQDPMGIALYTNSKNKISAFVGRKEGPLEGYIYQYSLTDENGVVCAKLIRKFGTYSGLKEIEAIAVDSELGYVYYSDENAGVRKYYAEPEKGDEQLAFFADTGFVSDQEGISIFKNEDGTGYIIVSNQQANSFYIYTREGSSENPHKHELIRIVNSQTQESDGNEICNKPFGDIFPHGLFVAMSEGKTFHLYNARDVIENN